jgi:hypothetical protein
VARSGKGSTAATLFSWARSATKSELAGLRRVTSGQRMCAAKCGGVATKVTENGLRVCSNCVMPGEEVAFRKPTRRDNKQTGGVPVYARHEPRTLTRRWERP